MASSEGHRGRLRQRFAASGLSGFHDYEAVELLLTYAIPRRDVKPLAKALLKRFKGLRGVLEAGATELESMPGMGARSASLLPLIREAAAAYIGEEPSRRVAVRSPADVAAIVRGGGYGSAAEALLAVYLNSKNEVLCVEPIHDGELSRAEISPRAVIERAFSHNARSIIFVHSRPGAAMPSKGEKRLAQELEAAARVIDILVHDHIILGEAAHASARELGWLKDGG